MTTNQIKYQELQEEKRHNAATEGLDLAKQEIEAGKLAETTRANKAKERLGVADQMQKTTSWISSLFKPETKDAINILKALI